MIVTRGLWRTLIAIASLLVLGAVVGVTVDRLMHRNRSDHTLLIEQVHADPLGTMQRELNLRPEQRARVGAILERRQSAIDSVWVETHVRLRAVIDSVVSEIAAVLDPDQAVRFRRLADELHSGPGGLPRH
jgi:Spy/CpxP family protein refolding chaperone